jgi:hypothetical protein
MLWDSMVFCTIMASNIYGCCQFHIVPHNQLCRNLCIFVFLYFLFTCMSNKRIKWYITFNTYMVVNDVLGVVIFFICIIVIHVTQGFVMFRYVNKFHNSTHAITSHFVKNKRRSLLSIFHSIHFLNSMFNHMVGNVISVIS